MFHMKERKVGGGKRGGRGYLSKIEDGELRAEKVSTKITTSSLGPTYHFTVNVEYRGRDISQTYRHRRQALFSSIYRRTT